MTDDPRDLLGPVLFECARRLDETAQAQVNREAGERVARPSVMRLLPFLTAEGIRPTELAKRVDVSKQAVGVALAELEARGLVAFEADPLDGRAQRVMLTPFGAEAYAHGHGVLRFYEGALAKVVGAAVVARLRKDLAAVLAVLESWERGGAPVRSAPTRPAGRSPSAAPRRAARARRRAR